MSGKSNPKGWGRGLQIINSESFCLVKQHPTASHVGVFRTAILGVKLSPLLLSLNYQVLTSFDRVNFAVITDLPREDPYII